MSVSVTAGSTIPPAPISRVDNVRVCNSREHHPAGPLHLYHGVHARVWRGRTDLLQPLLHELRVSSTRHRVI